MSSLIASSSRATRMTAAMAVFLAAMLLPLSFTGGVVTTPAISHALGGSPAALTWLTNGFMLTFGSLLLTAGIAADMAGRKRIFIAGLIIFCVSNLFIYLAQSTAIIGVFRALQGIAAAMTLAGGSAALAQLYNGNARTRAFSLLGTMFGAGLAFGPLLIGLITDVFGWRWVYASMAMLSGIVALTGSAFLPPSEKQPPQKADIAGIALFTLALILFTSAVMLLPVYGFLSLPVLALFIASTLLIRWFVNHCRKIKHPVFDIALLRSPRFAGVLLLPVATCYCYVVLLIIIPLHFMGGDGLSETQSAFYLLALTGPMLVFPSLAAFLTRWFTPGAVSATGLILAAAGLLALGQALQGGSISLLLFSLVIIGAGAALPWGLMDGLAVSAVPVEQAGMAAGLFNTVRVAGEGIALAMVTALLVAINHLKLREVAADYSPDVINDAVNWLGGGNIDRAADLLPTVSRMLLRESYDSAYTFLFQALAGMTLVCAFMVWKMLRKNGHGQT
ncbi:MFS transporter [Kosakonia oryziphila]|uniref:Major Facilitator Superfamily protein n=1 Tax=Kosakonia oryziphila TaxID=1005667 RepID=A0A1C4B8D8_9ENTR|nr:MFS transporter [Kosakonia oryziphila]SCC03119.1 Major Facilitator Superfamily protein [Kosakonia oryziphila]